MDVLEKDMQMSSKRQGGIIPTDQTPYCKLQAPDESSTRWTNGFWADRFNQCHKSTIPYLLKWLKDPKRSYCWTGMLIAAGLEEGEEGISDIADEHGAVTARLNDGVKVNKFKGTRWNDEFVYKLLEAMAHVYAVTPDPELDREMDNMIEVIGKVQCPDGYIATQTQLSGIARFQVPANHELYVMGHLLTAACAHHRATGKTTLLEIAEKAADYLYVTFMPRDPKLAHFCVNPSYIMGAVDLYRTTKRKKYLELAQCFVDMRGSQPGGTDLNQTAVPLRQETHIVGHGVFFGYLNAGAADVYMESGDETLVDPLKRLWADLEEKKSYITACATPIRRGVSIRNHNVHEAAGRDYELPNTSGYNETCANIAAAMWGYRMLAMTGDAHYANYMERAFYNGILSGQGIEGTSWFYVNVLRWWGKEQDMLWQDMPQRRDPGFDRQICCPSNMVRTMASVQAYAYSISKEGMWVNLYGGNSFNGALADGSTLKLTQETNYPWDGQVKLTITDAPGCSFGVYLRIPDWANNATISVNGQSIKSPAAPGTYAKVERVWNKGDVIELNLPMTVKIIQGHYKIEEVRNQVCVMRGPIVYCLESVDLPEGKHMWEIHLPRDIEFTAKYEPELLGGVTVLEGTARYIPEDWNRELYQEYKAEPGEPISIHLIPYYAWCNRGETEMTVWMPTI